MTFKARTHEEPHRKCITASVISAVEIAEALFQRQLAVGQQGVPLDVPTVTEHSGQGGIDQVLLGRAIAVDQGLRDAELLGQRTRTIGRASWRERGGADEESWGVWGTI